MDDYGIGCSNDYSDGSELETLQRVHQEKITRIHELKRQIESVKLRLEERKKKKKELSDDRKQNFKILSERYNSLREEYKALLADRSRGK